NGNADVLSRWLLEEENDVEERSTRDPGVVINNLVLQQTDFNEDQLEDDAIAELHSWIRTGGRPDTCDKTNPELFIYWCQSWRFKIFGKNVYRRYDKDESGIHYQYVVPVKDRTEVLKKIHNDPFSGHLGIDKTTHKIRHRFTWLRYLKDVADKVRADMLRCYETVAQNADVKVSKFKILRGPKSTLLRTASDVRGPCRTQTYNAQRHPQRGRRGIGKKVVVSVVDFAENKWLMQMIRTTPFDGQLMICGPENYISCWVPINGPYERTDRSRLEEATSTNTTGRETEKETEHTLVSTLGRGIELYPDSQISVRLDTLFGAIIGRGRGIGLSATMARARAKIKRTRSPNHRGTSQLEKRKNIEKLENRSHGEGSIRWCLGYAYRYPTGNIVYRSTSDQLPIKKCGPKYIHEHFDSLGSCSWSQTKKDWDAFQQCGISVVHHVRDHHLSRSTLPLAHKKDLLNRCNESVHFYQFYDELIYKKELNVNLVELNDSNNNPYGLDSVDFCQNNFPVHKSLTAYQNVWIGSYSGAIDSPGSCSWSQTKEDWDAFQHKVSD
ncbi:Retrovirus-related Pol poly from transposon, partial [Brachionus plicatilis]